MADARPLGLATLSVLHAIARGVEYGFDVCDHTGLPSGPVYPALSRLEDQGLVASQWESSEIAQREKRPARRYYSITAAGERALNDSLARYRRLQPLRPARPCGRGPRRGPAPHA